MDLRMQSLHPAAQHFRPVGVVGHVFHRHAALTQEFRSSAGRENFDFQRHQPAGKFQNAGFVEYAEQRALHSHVASNAVKDPPVYAEAQKTGNADLWEKSTHCHSERSEESAFHEKVRKTTFLGQTPPSE